MIMVRTGAGDTQLVRDCSGKRGGSGCGVGQGGVGRGQLAGVIDN